MICVGRHPTATDNVEPEIRPSEGGDAKISVKQPEPIHEINRQGLTQKVHLLCHSRRTVSLVAPCQFSPSLKSRSHILAEE